MKLYAAAILIETLTGLRANQLDLRPIDEIERDARFRRVNLSFQRLIKLLERRLLDLHGFRQVEVVQFPEMMPQGRVHFCFSGGGLENVTVAYALFLRQLHRQEQERRMDALFGELLEIVPSQKTEHQAKLRKAIFRAVAPRFADHLVQDARNVRRILESKVFAEGHRRGFSNRSRECRVPDEELFELDVPIVQHKRHGGLGEV